MSDDDSSPTNQEAAAIGAELESQLGRVGVDGSAIWQIHQISAPEEEIADEDEDGNHTYSISFSLDVSGIIETLRQLPDGAGTAEFVLAYNRTHRDWRHELSDEH